MVMVHVCFFFPSLPPLELAFSNIGDERNIRARKGTSCTILMWGYKNIHICVLCVCVCAHLILASILKHVCTNSIKCVSDNTQS
jgi:predicted metal-binding membrane protein